MERLVKGGLFSKIVEVRPASIQRGVVAASSLRHYLLLQTTLAQPLAPQPALPSMRNLFLAATLLLSATAVAQVPRRTPATGSASPANQPYDYPLSALSTANFYSQPGSYRLADGTWHAADVHPPHHADRVLLRPEGQREFSTFFPREIAAYVVQGDTFVTMPPFVRRRHHQLIPAAFVHVVYHDGGYEVFSYDGTPPPSSRYSPPPTRMQPPLAPVDPPEERHDGVDLLTSIFSPGTYYSMVLRHDGMVQELPVNRAAYHRLMLTLLADDPLVCAQLRAEPRMSCWYTPYLLTSYAAHQRETRLRAQR